MTPRQHRGATPVSSSTTSLELSHSHTSKTEVGIVGVGVKLSGRTRNAHHAQLVGQEMESGAGDFRWAKQRDRRSDGKTLFPPFSSLSSSCACSYRHTRDN